MPAGIENSVRSVTHGMFGRSAWKSLSTRFAGVLVNSLLYEPWIGNGVLDGFLEDESLFGEFLRTPVSEGGVEPPVVGPLHVVVGVVCVIE